MGEAFNRSKAWRPNQAELGQIESMSGIGLKETQMAAILGVSISTFQNAEKKSDAMSRCLLKGRAIASSNVLSTAYEMATSKMHPAMTIFWLKVREGWKDTSFVELTEKIVKKISEEDPEERRKRIAEKLKRRQALDE